jgi:hypothetical protein
MKITWKDNQELETNGRKREIKKVSNEVVADHPKTNALGGQYLV